MVTRLSILIIIILQAQRAANSPLRNKRSPLDLGPIPTQSHLYPTLQNTGTHVIPIFAQHTGSHSVTVLPQHIVFKNNGHNAPLLAPIPLSQFFFHSKLHVIPRQNIIQSSIQHVNKDVKIPVISHHTVSHTSPNANVTHSTSVIPVFIPIHRHLVPVHDLSVIPLQRHHKVEKLGHYRMEKNQEDDEETSNQYRKFYGGHGAGLFFGGQGAGHGYYAYGK